jgi:hypothetical protein
MEENWQEPPFPDNSTKVVSGKEAGWRKIPSQQDQSAFVKALLLPLILFVSLGCLLFLPGLLFDCFGISGVLGIWLRSWGVFWASFACTLPLVIAAIVGRKGWLRSLSRLLLSSAWGLAGWLLGASVPIHWLSWVLGVLGGLLGFYVGLSFHASISSSRDDRYS